MISDLPVDVFGDDKGDLLGGLIDRPADTLLKLDGVGIVLGPHLLEGVSSSHCYSPLSLLKLLVGCGRRRGLRRGHSGRGTHGLTLRTDWLVGRYLRHDLFDSGSGGGFHDLIGRRLRGWLIGGL